MEISHLTSAFGYQNLGLLHHRTYSTKFQDHAIATRRSTERTGLVTVPRRGENPLSGPTCSYLVALGAPKHGALVVIVRSEAG